MTHLKIFLSSRDISLVEDWVATEGSFEKIKYACSL